MAKKLYKNTFDKKVSGVCSGFAEYINADVTVIRIFTLFIIFCTFPIGLIFYFICACIMPDKKNII